MSDITHERCSESLPGLLGRRLAPDEALAVEEHLQGCAECRGELTGLRALTDDLTPLSDVERAGLRRAVRATLLEAEALGPAKAPVWRRAAPFLSAAAALLILGFAITSLDLGGSDEMVGSDVGAEGGGAELERSQEEEGETAAGGAGKGSGSDQATADEPLPDAAAPEDATSGGEESTEVAAGQAAVGGRDPGIPVFGLGQRFRIGRLERETHARRPYRSAARSFDPGNLKRDRKEHLRTLGRLASFRGRSAGDLKTCAHSIEGSEQLLPVLGAYGTFEGQKALVLGFISATGNSYDRYLIAIWTPPDNCSKPRILQGRLR